MIKESLEQLERDILEEASQKDKYRFLYSQMLEGLQLLKTQQSILEIQQQEETPLYPIIEK